MCRPVVYNGRVKNRSRRSCLTPILIVLIPLCVVVGWLGFTGVRLMQIGRSLQTHQAQAETLLANGVTSADPAATARLVRDVRTDVVALNRQVRPFLWLTPALEWLPRVGPLMPEAREYLTLADAGTRAADALAPTIEGGLSVLQSAEADTIPAALAVLDDATSAFAAIESDVAIIQTTWNSLESKEALPWAIRQRIETIDTYLPLADEGVEAAQIVPELLGANGEKTYLLLIQNDDERRATGGFVSGIGILRVADGDIVSLDFQSTDINYEWFLENSELFVEPPPEPLLNIMDLQYFLYRDANYWPDFPTSAEKIIELYALEYPDAPIFDGLIALDQQFVAILLDGTGQVFVPELEQSVTRANVVSVLRKAWDPPEGEVVTRDWWLNRKSFVGDVAKAIQERILTDPTQLDFVGMGNAMLEAVETRHLQIYSTDPAIAAQLAELGWDGSVQPRASGDFLLVVDANMGYNKANGSIERGFVYDVNLGEKSAELTINYIHTAPPRAEPCEPQTRYTGELRYQNMLDACLYNYVRVYPAPGSTLVGGSTHPTPGELTLTGQSFDGQPVTIDESPRHFANFHIVNPATTLPVSFEYRLPDTVVEDGVYRLLLQKQAGAGMESAKISVTIPDGATIASTTPIASINGSTATFRLEFDRDVEIEVAYTP